jgi:hypothetical protein
LTAEYEPELYSQGSFRLGTVVKPISNAVEFDIDLVCEFKALEPQSIGQQALKSLVGDRLRENTQYRKMLDEGNRCWTLEYSESEKFHMDILPSVPDADALVSPYSQSAIAVPDRDLRQWQPSNPNGYANWFKNRMAVELQRRRLRLAEAIRADVQDIPEFRVKTPLQRAIQLLKRHRDQVFSRNTEDKPISIIITTLAAHAYENQADLVDALQGILEQMDTFVESRNAVPWVPNPTNSEENFAEKWRNHPIRARKFHAWLEQARHDFASHLDANSSNAMAESMRRHLGSQIVYGDSAVGKPKTAHVVTGGVATPHIKISQPNKPWKCGN